MAQSFKTPNFTNNEAGLDTLSIEEYLDEVYDFNKSEAARSAKNSVWIRVCRYTKHDHNGMTPQEVWGYIRETTKGNIDHRHKLAVEFLRGYVSFCKIDHPDIPIPLNKNTHKEGGNYSKPRGTYALPPEKRKRKNYLCKLRDTTLPGTVGGARTIMSRVGGIQVPDELVAHRIIGIPKIIRKGTYDVEEDEGKPLTAEQARFVIEKLSHDVVIPICYFMNYTGFRIGEVFTVKKSDFEWIEERQLLRVRIPSRVIKDTVTKGWRYLPPIAWEKIRPLLDGIPDDFHPFRSSEGQRLSSFENNVLKTLRVVYDKHPELREKDPDNNRFFFNTHSWRSRCSTEYARTQGIPNADGYIRHARGLTTYYKKTKEEREKAFFEACPDLAIYQVDKEVAKNKLQKIELSLMQNLQQQLDVVKEELERQKNAKKKNKN